MAARKAVRDDKSPVRWMIIGIVDVVEDQEILGVSHLIDNRELALQSLQCLIKCRPHAAQASLREVTVHELEVAVEGTIDLPTFFGIREGNSGYQRLRVTLYVRCDAEGPLLDEIAYRAVNLSPVVNTVFILRPLADLRRLARGWVRTASFRKTCGTQSSLNIL